MGEQVKLKAVLHNILNSCFKISDEQKQEILKNVKEEATIIDKLTTNTHIYINWLEWALQHFQRQKPSKQALIFFIDVLIELSKNKIIFVLLHQNNIFKQIIHVIKDSQDCDIFRSYIKFLNSFAYTEFGRNWLCSSFDHWQNVFKLIPSRKYTEDLSIFLKDLFLSVFNCSKLFAIDLSALILAPLTSISSRILQGNLEGLVEEDLSIELIPTIDLVSSVILCISESVTLDNEWLSRCNNLLNLQKPLTILLEIIEGEELTLELSRLLIALTFLQLKQYSKKPLQFINLFVENAVNLINFNGNRKFVNNVTIFSYHLQRFWFHICRLFNVKDLDIEFDFGICLTLYQTYAVIGICSKVLGERAVAYIENDEVREQIIWNLMKKIKKSLHEPTHKLINILLTIEDLRSEAHLALDYLIKSIDLYDFECKKICFHTFLYILRDIIGDIHKTNSLKSKFYDCDLITHFVNSFIFYVTECAITWKDDQSIMLALDTATDLLQIQDLPNDLIVAALKMLDLAIDKNMAPNLILLVDSSTEVSIGPIGEILETNLNSESEEVRSAASKVLLTISESAKSKYPFFQNLILELNVCQLLMENIFSNEVTEVKAYALKCFQHLVRIDAVWDDFTANPDFLVSIINLLKIETDNLLRAELVNLVTAIYEQDHFTDLQVEDLYEILTRLGVHDFDVAVRINTLKFWDVVIKKLLIEEGMIDNEFPEFTFSKNSKKIVILDEYEIQRRLRRFMSNLSEIGCLTVVNSCFTSKEMSEKQCVDEIITNILTVLERYDIDEDNVNCGKNILDDILSPRHFLENITQLQDNNFNGYVRNFTVILDEIISYNKLDRLDLMDSYL